MEAAKAEPTPEVKKETKSTVSQNGSAAAGAKTVSKDRAEAAAFLKVCWHLFHP